MALIDPILDELRRESETTRRVLDRVPTASLSWRPHPRSRTLGDLAWHIATIPGRIGAMALVDDADTLVFKAPPRPDTAEEMAAVFSRGVADAREKLAGLGDDDLRRKILFRSGEKRLAHLPKIAFLRGVMLNHAYHHRGQLSVYLRLLDVPVPPIYGPTADEG